MKVRRSGRILGVLSFWKPENEGECTVICFDRIELLKSEFEKDEMQAVVVGARCLMDKNDEITNLGEEIAIGGAGIKTAGKALVKGHYYLVTFKGMVTPKGDKGKSKNQFRSYEVEELIDLPESVA